MPDEEDEDVEKILDPDLSKEEQRQRKTEQLNDELGEYDIEEEPEIVDNSYDSIDPQDVAKLKNEILQQQNLDTKKKVGQMDDVEKRFAQMMEFLDSKSKGYQKGKRKALQHHPAWSGVIASLLIQFGYMLHSSAFILYGLGWGYILAEVYQEQERDYTGLRGKYKLLIARHPIAYGAAAGASILIFTAANQNSGPIEGVAAAIFKGAAIYLGG